MGKRAFQLLLLASLATGTLWAAGDPFIGRWKLDPSRSKVTDLMRVAAAGTNKYTLIFNSGGLETVVADGTDQPALFGTTVSVTVAGPNDWKVVRKKDGRTLLTGIWKLSQDGKTLSDAFTSYPSNGASSTVNYVYLRTAGYSGFSGSWESQSQAAPSAFELRVEPFESEGLSFFNSGGDLPRSMKFDGREYPGGGQSVAPGTMSSGRRLSTRKLELTERIKGRIADVQQLELSSDLKTLTVTIHPSGQSRPNVYVLNRQ